MPYTTLHSRQKTGVVDDADPNAASPAAEAVTEYDTFRLDANEIARGWVYYLIFRDAGGAEVSSATATVTPWIRDEVDDSWANAQSDSNAGNRQLFQCAHFFSASAIFFQLTNIAGVGVDSVEVRLGAF